MSILCKLGSSFVLLMLVSTSYGQEVENDLEIIEVVGEDDFNTRKTGLEDYKIYTGKKNTRIDVSDSGPVITNNYRQVLTEVPGLTVAEVNNESWASITYRGLGDPHESFNLLTLEDGIPISADMYGYPAAYYQPPMDTVKQLEFLRGGSALLFGPQAGGALNFITQEPGASIFNGRARLLTGEYGYSQGYLQADGHSGQFSYLIGAHGRQSEGFRVSNGDYSVHGYNLKLGYEVNSQLNIKVRAQDYTGRHGEAGGLARTSTAVDSIGIDRSYKATTSPFDEILIDRDFLGISVYYEPSEDQKWSVDVWHSNLRRSSFRQDFASGQSSFGVVKRGTTNDITHQHFNTYGGQIRGVTHTSFFSNDLDWTYGYRYYQNSNPLENLTGASVDAKSGVRELVVERRSLSHSVFSEAALQLGNWSLVPGFRYEYLQQDLNEEFRSANVVRPGNTLGGNSFENNVFLYGLGIEKIIQGTRWKFIANSSSGFTPALFAEAFPISPADEINEDLSSSKIFNHEMGLVGEFAQTASAEVSAFYIDTSNQVGRVGNRFTNVGDAQYYGVEGLVSFDAFRELFNTAHSLRATLSYSFLEARFNSGDPSHVGKTPQYAPQHSMRWRLSYRHKSSASITLSGQWLSEHFADDANTGNFSIPSYIVWDLSAEIPLWYKDLNLQLAVRNLSNQQYFARIRSNGIEPGMPRLATAGLQYVF